MDCMNEIVTARNTVTRKVGRYARRLVEHPVHGKYLEEVPADTKQFKTIEEISRNMRTEPIFEFEPETTEEEAD